MRHTYLYLFLVLCVFLFLFFSSDSKNDKLDKYSIDIINNIKEIQKECPIYLSILCQKKRELIKSDIINGDLIDKAKTSSKSLTKYEEAKQLYNDSQINTRQTSEDILKNNVTNLQKLQKSMEELLKSPYPYGIFKSSSNSYNIYPRTDVTGTVLNSKNVNTYKECGEFADTNCKAFTFDPTTKTCSVYSSIMNTIPSDKKIYFLKV